MPRRALQHFGVTFERNRNVGPKLRGRAVSRCYLIFRRHRRRFSDGIARCLDFHSAYNAARDGSRSTLSLRARCDAAFFRARSTVRSAARSMVTSRTAIAARTWSARRRATPARAARGFSDRLRPPVLSPGMLIANRYHVRRLLGVGAMGEVHEVEDRLLGTVVALKTLNARLAGDAARARAAQARGRRRAQRDPPERLPHLRSRQRSRATRRWARSCS